MYRSGQNKRIQNYTNFLREENVVINKDVAFRWILQIGKDYNKSETPEGLMSLVDEMMAYAALGLERVD